MSTHLGEHIRRINALRDVCLAIVELIDVQLMGVHQRAKAIEVDHITEGLFALPQSASIVPAGP